MRGGQRSNEVGGLPAGAQRPANGDAASWEWVQSRTLEALEASIAFKEKDITLVRASTHPVDLPPPGRKLLYVNTTKPPNGRWGGEPFYLIDADRSMATKPPLHAVELAYEPSARRIVPEITPELRSALGEATRVHVVYSDNQELALMRLLQPCLKQATRAPRLLDLWDAGHLAAAADVPGLNPEQALAFSAMTTEGGCLIWGPPGTGKTTVIVQAVAEALRHGRSVLIASHTHVAVDNVVKDLAGTVSEPGRIIRIGGADKVDPEVTDHEWLMLDKAAAVLTDRDARLREILKQRRANTTDRARRQLDSVSERLDEVDLPLIERAYSAREHATRAAAALATIRDLELVISEREREIDSLPERLTRESTAAYELPQLRASTATLEARGHELVRWIEAGDHNLRGLLVARTAALQDLAAATARRDGWRGRVPLRRSALEASCAAADRAVADFGHQIDVQKSTTADLREQHKQLGAEYARIQTRIVDAQAAEHRAQRLRDLLTELRTAQQQDRGRRDQINARSSKDRAEAAMVPGYQEIINHAETTGVRALLAERETLNDLVADLDEKLEELEKQERRLADEYRKTRQELLESAPVVACTLTALTTKPELIGRRFDTVIIDEAASAQVSQLVYAGSKADRSLAYVGDFLQNSPIAETDDAKTAPQQGLLPWQSGDIFALLGIHDRATAEAHPRCVALRTQFRYPKIIADIVNDFCYDDLLLTDWRGTIDGPVVTFVDTSRHRDRGLRRQGTSWVHPLGIDLMDAVYRDHDSARTIGLVCPYRAHALRAQSIADRNGYVLPCGTSHRFQGRQFDTVVLDLMQDDNPTRWAGQADLTGSERDVSAAKLLNVAITRTKRHLVIIGDWRFVQHSRKPGMRAIAALRGRAEFEVIEAAALLERGAGVR